MKKVILLFAAIVCFALISNNLSAQNNTTNDKTVVKTEQSVATPGNFVDKDKNGICDNQSKVRNARGANFVDKNKDGICDKHAEKGKANAKCDGTGKGQGNCCGQQKGKGNCCGQQKGNCNRNGQNR